MAASIGPSLATAFDYVWQRFVDRLDGLTDAEYFWEPAGDSWSVRRAADGTWVMDGAARGAEPDPPPITTIAWRVCHIGGVLRGFAARLFGADASSLLPGSTTEVPGFLDADYRAWRDGMDTFDDDQWWGPLGRGWGPYADDSKADLAIHTFDEIVHHAAEVGLLRDLYRDALRREARQAGTRISKWASVGAWLLMVRMSWGQADITATQSRWARRTT